MPRSDQASRFFSKSFRIFLEYFNSSFLASLDALEVLLSDYLIVRVDFTDVTLVNHKKT